MQIDGSRSMLDGCGIETKKYAHGPGLRYRQSRSMLDGCGIETPEGAFSLARLMVKSRSMLDGCGIETTLNQRRCNLVSGVAIDARWLWNRDT